MPKAEAGGEASGLAEPARRRPLKTVDETWREQLGRDSPPTPAKASAGRPRWWRDSLRRRLLALADTAAAAVACLLAEPGFSGSFRALALLPLWLFLAKLVGLYDRDHRAIRHLTMDEVPSIAGWAAGGTALVATLLPLTGGQPLTASRLVLVWAVASVGAFLLRALARLMWRRITPPELTIVLGDGEYGDAIRRKAQLFSDMHLKLIDTALLSTANGFGGRLSRATELLRRVDRVVIAKEAIDPDVIGELSSLCKANQVKLSVVSPLRGRACPAPRISQVAELPVLEYNTWDPSRSTLALKRVFDLAVASAGLIITAPLFPLIALAIKLDSRGPVFFVQRRAGENGQAFGMYKFRTMKEDAERDLADVVPFDKLAQPMFKLARDPRVTRVGRLLRRFSLDELPQFINVLIGDMSIVGPRPEQIDLVSRYLPEHRFRLSVKPGMTGPMQVFGRGELTFEERLAVELDYVENLSLTRDLRLILQTLPVITRGNGAY